MTSTLDQPFQFPRWKLEKRDRGVRGTSRLSTRCVAGQEVRFSNYVFSCTLPRTRGWLHAYTRCTRSVTRAGANGTGPVVHRRQGDSKAGKKDDPNV